MTYANYLDFLIMANSIGIGFDSQPIIYMIFKKKTKKQSKREKYSERKQHRKRETGE